MEDKIRLKMVKLYNKYNGFLLTGIASEDKQTQKAVDKWRKLKRKADKIKQKNWYKKYNVKDKWNFLNQN